VKNKPPNARLLEAALGDGTIEPAEVDEYFHELETTFNPFSRLMEIKVPVKCKHEHL
jgi:hypothetical protein